MIRRGLHAAGVSDGEPAFHIPDRALLGAGDPRQSWKVLYPLAEILLVVLCATVAGAEDFVEIRRWGTVNLKFLRRQLPFADGIASHDTLNDVINAVDGELFSRCFGDWVESLRDAEPDIVAIDGKTSRRTHDLAKARGPLHLVSAWASRQRLVLGQQVCEAKSNEITAIPVLLDRLALTVALVTIDAMGCQTRIAQKILDKRADYLLAIKENWPSLHGEIEHYFEAADPARLDRFETVDGDHGRIEQRRHFVAHDVDWLVTDRRFPGKPRFPGLAAIAMVEAEVERDAKISRERRYSSLRPHSTPSSSPAPCDAIGTSKIVSTGCWMSSSTKTSTDCAPAPDPRTWPPPDTWPSTCSAPPRTNTASKSEESPPLGIPDTSKLSSVSQHDPLQAIPLRGWP